MKKHIEHVMKQIDVDIAKLNDKTTSLEDLKRSINNLLVEKYTKFRCPEGKSDYAALCPECPNVLPEIYEIWVNKGRKQGKKYPAGMQTEASDICVDNKEGCAEWRKKRETTACGCEGTSTCVCGYQYDYCYFNDISCKYCGREMSSKPSEMQKNMLQNMRDFTVSMDKKKKGE